MTRKNTDICRQHKTANPKRLISGAVQAGL